jgi:hypothetical protein
MSIKSIVIMYLFGHEIQQATDSFECWEYFQYVQNAE